MFWTTSKIQELNSTPEQGLESRLVFKMTYGHQEDGWKRIVFLSEQKDEAKVQWWLK